MNDSISTDDRRLCQIYGEQSREFHAAASWEDCSDRLQRGWLRIRGDCTLCWQEVEPYVRRAWQQTAA